MKTSGVRILLFDSGNPMGGGLDFQEMVEQSRTTPPILNADIVAVVSNYPNGGVYERAKILGVPFEYWPGPFTAEGYRGLVEKYKADFIMCSGWLKRVKGLDPARTVSIYPGPLREFGGLGAYSHHVYEEVIKAFKEGKLKQISIVMYFVSGKNNRGPVFFQLPVIIREGDTPETLAVRVNEKERAWQSHKLNEVVQGYIYWYNGRVCFRDDTPKRQFFSKA